LQQVSIEEYMSFPVLCKKEPHYAIYRYRHDIFFHSSHYTSCYYTAAALDGATGFCVCHEINGPEGSKKKNPASGSCYSSNIE
jgi:hypothetical protein